MIVYCGLFIVVAFVWGLIIGLLIARDHYKGGDDE